MEIILKEDIIGLGYKNDIVNVKNGYGRNYLIPTGKAVIASESARKVLAEDLKQQASKLAAKKAEAEKKAEQLKDVEVVVTAKVAATGYLYGSVTAAIVAEELAKKGLDIDRKIITMKDAKKVGDFPGPRRALCCWDIPCCLYFCGGEGGFLRAAGQCAAAAIHLL